MLYILFLLLMFIEFKILPTLPLVILLFMHSEIVIF